LVASPQTPGELGALDFIIIPMEQAASEIEKRLGLGPNLGGANG
jgi:hypothetical protein